MLISIDDHDSRPIYLQIISQIKQQLAAGILNPGDELPSVRELADILGINLHTVRRAYIELRDQDIISLRLGRRAKINRMPQPLPTLDNSITSAISDILNDALTRGLSREDVIKILDAQIKRLKR